MTVLHQFSRSFWKRNFIFT